MTGNFIVGKRYRLVTRMLNGRDQYPNVPVGTVFTVARVDSEGWAEPDIDLWGRRFHRDVCEPVSRFGESERTETML